jgi:hypothetical protein
MKKTFSPLLLFSLLIPFLLAACSPSQPASPPPENVVEPTLAAPAPEEPVLTSTPTPEPLPTETPLPQPTAVPVQLQIALLNTATDLLLWQETTQTLRTLLPATDGLDVRLSDDGTRLAFIKDIDFGQVELWVVNTDGTNARQLLSVDALRALDPPAAGVTIFQWAWIPGTHTLAFNTVEYVQAPGQFLNDDLHFLDADTGELSTQLTPGTGGNFVFSPDGQQYALIGFDNDAGEGSISLLNTDGTNIRTNVLTYPYVLTYSEYQYYADPVWSPDSTFLRVAIPPQDSLGDPTSHTLLWEIPLDGSTGFLLGEVLTQPFFMGGVQFAPDLNHIAYTRLPDPNDYLNAELVIANADGSEEMVYATGNLFFNAWAPDSQQFIFEDNMLQETYLGSIGSDYTLLTDVPYALNVTWLDATRFLFTVQTETTWQLRLGTPGQPSISLLDLPDGLVRYDFDK